MKVIKAGRQRLFEQDSETAATVSRMLLDLEKNGMDAVRRYSREFDEWDPPSFRLTPLQIEAAIAQLPEQAIADTDYCQGNVRRFAEAQLRTLLPLDEETILQSVKKTNKCLVVHEDTKTGGIAGEIAAILCEKAFGDLDGPLMRVTALDTPVPYSPPLEEYFLPNAKKIFDAAKELARY